MPCTLGEHNTTRLAKYPNRPVHPPVDVKISTIALPPLHDGVAQPAIAGPSVPRARPVKRPASPTTPSEPAPAVRRHNAIPDDNVIVISESSSDSDSDSNTSNVEGDKVVLSIKCEHHWVANPVRKADSAVYYTVIKVPQRRNCTVRADDIPPHALEELRLGDIGFERLQVWAGDGYRSAFAESDNSVRYDWTDQASLMATLALSVSVSGLEIGRHVPLEPEEFQTDQDWQLGQLLLNITCTQYSQGYKSGGSTTFRVVCRAPRRRINIDDCLVQV